MVDSLQGDKHRLLLVLRWNFDVVIHASAVYGVMVIANDGHQLFVLDRLLVIDFYRRVFVGPSENNAKDQNGEESEKVQLNR